MFACRRGWCLLDMQSQKIVTNQSLETKFLMGSLSICLVDFRREVCSCYLGHHFAFSCVAALAVADVISVTAN